jgi:hypothetical protein
MDKLYRLYRWLFFFIPLPIFFNLQNLEVINKPFNNVDADLDFFVPVPIGSIAYTFILFIGFYLSFASKKYTQTLFSKNWIIIFSFIIFPFLLSYMYFVSGLAFLRIMQVFFPLFIIIFSSVPIVKKEFRYISLILFSSISLIIIMHTISLIYNSETFFIGNKKDFPYIFSFAIYQGYTTYTAVLSIYFYIFLIYLFFIYRSFFKFILILLIFYIGFSGARNIFLLESMSIIGSIAIFYIYSAYSNNLNFDKMHKFNLILLLLVVVFVSFIFFYSPGYDRLQDSKEDLSGTRVNIYISAIEYFFLHPIFFFFGNGGKISPGFHNYILDLVYRIGFFGSLIFLIIFFYLYSKKYTFNKIKINSNKKFLFFIFFFLPFWQNIFNVGFSQLFYFINFYAVLLIMYNFTVFEIKA